MSCKYSKFDADDGRYSCSVSGDGCMYLIPSSKQCAEDYQEGPDTDKLVSCNDCIHTENEGGESFRYCTHDDSRHCGDCVENFNAVCEYFESN